MSRLRIDQLTKMFLGGTAVTRAYLGNEVVYSGFAYSDYALALDFKNQIYGVGGAQVGSGPVYRNTFLDSQNRANGNNYNAVVTVNDALAPDGTLTADKITPNAGTSLKGYGRLCEMALGWNTVSHYVKKGGQRFHAIWLDLNNNGYANYDLLNGTAAAYNGASAYIVDAGDYYRLVMAYRSTSGTQNIYFTPADSLAHAWNAPSATVTPYHVWQAQVLAGHLPDGGPVILTGAGAAESDGGIADVPGYSYARSGTTKLEGEAVANNSLYGPELLTNGDGSTLTGWQMYSGGSGLLSSEGGRLRVQGNGVASKYFTTVPTVVGQRYRLRADLFGKATLGIEVGGSLTHYSDVDGNTVDTEFVATGTNTYVTITARDSGAFLPATEYAEFDNISLTTSNLYQFEGPELIVNTEFNTDTVWTKGIGWTIANGKASYSGNNSAYALVHPDIAYATKGRTFRVRLRATMLATPDSQAAIMVNIGGNGENLLVQSSTGLVSGQVVVLDQLVRSVDGASTSTPRIGSNLNYQMDFEVDSFSVTEVFSDAFDSFAPNVPGIVPGVGYWSRSAVTNTVTSSTNVDSAYWIKHNTTALANDAIAPDGTRTATKITPSAGLLVHSYYQPVTHPAGDRTASVFVKKGGQRFHQIYADTSTTDYANFDIQTGTAAAFGTGVTAFCVDYGDYYRLVLVWPSASTANNKFYHGIAASLASAWNVSVDNQTPFHVWGMQILNGNHRDGGPIIPTGAAAASVGADALTATTITLADVDQIFMVEWTVTQVAGSSGFVMVITNGANYIGLGQNSGYGWGAAVINSVTTTLQEFPGALALGTGKVLLRRRGGKWSSHSRFGTTTTIGADGPVTVLNPGTYNVTDSQMNVPVRFFGHRIGTFSDADITAILEAA